MTSKQKQHGTATRTCTSCGHAFTTWRGDDETMCNPCIIASFGDPAPVLTVSDRTLEAMDEEDAIAYIKAGGADEGSE